MDKSKVTTYSNLSSLVSLLEMLNQSGFE